ncbi:LuxR C-terminal-related transcriptional regulator [Kineococcus rubinsiae]|uniref:LuxR C-terminal-related transcriptional regulator n=1 Tax=Kineococcus rubinsiae TaxID=2609562 RepID=UPI00143186BC|nr:LuxR C-terminal-related transcriptional regulator [Kineococcus rubinsiae]NIZ90369.1 hypothetical protein [Kineococcus rubinsiae]
MTEDPELSIAALSNRDRQLLLLISSGSSALEAARELHVSLDEVALQLLRIRRLLGVSSTAAAVKILLGGSEP